MILPNSAHDYGTEEKNVTEPSLVKERNIQNYMLYIVISVVGLVTNVLIKNKYDRYIVWLHNIRQNL